MRKIRVLHCADMHLGSEMTRIPEKSKERQEELLRTFRRIVKRSNEEKVDLLLIAGDLFDSSGVPRNVVSSVMEYLKEAKARVFISPGNHDYVSLDSPYVEPWPENVHIFQGDMEKVVLEDLQTVVYGAGFQGTYVKKSLFTKEPVDPQHLNLCVIHGDLVGPGVQSLYHGITKEDLRSSGMDYVALGHIHKRTEVLQIGETYYSYPGCPEGRGFDELGEKGVYVGTLYKGGHDLAFVPLCERQYLRFPITLEKTSSVVAAEREILTHLEEAFGDSYENHHYHLILQGTYEEGEELSMATLQGHLAEKLYYVRLQNALTLEVDYEALAKEANLKGIFVQRLLEELQEAKEKDDERSIKICLRALEVGLKSFEGSVESLGD